MHIYNLISEIIFGLMVACFAIAWLSWMRASFISRKLLGYLEGHNAERLKWLGTTQLFGRDVPVTNGIRFIRYVFANDADDDETVQKFKIQMRRLMSFTRNMLLMIAGLLVVEIYFMTSAAIK